MLTHSTHAEVITGDGAGIEAIAARRDEIRAAVRTRGAALLRGFQVGDVDGFNAVVRAVSGAPLTYAEKSSPRTAIKGDIYTSTDYPAEEEIFLHNENSYQQVWPMTLFFYCVTPPSTSGATPLADTRRVLAAIDPAVREEFEARGWMAVRNFRAELGLDWTHVFGTGDRAAVDEYCAERGIETSWQEDGGLRTRAVRTAVHVHPATGERVWFNHATFFHVTTLGDDLREGLLSMMDEADLPTNSYYGDGGRIPGEVLDHLRSCYRAATTRFDYERDDVLVIDNMLAAHGREPFTGPRRIAVAMAEPVTSFR